MRNLAMGIDLGTSNSCVAIWENGTPIVILNSWGEATQASCVSFLNDGSIIVGNSAKRRQAIDPHNTISSAKRLIGRFYFSEEVKKAQSMNAFTICEGKDQSVQIQVREQKYSIPEISAMVLKEMRAIAEAYVGESITRAVITVPAFFNDAQRQETKNAGAIAGLDVLRILNEPTAAALAYGFGQNLEQKIVVYDFGGGTFDVSILQIGQDIFEVLSTAGDTYLGGDDFDERIVDWCLNIIKQNYQLDLSQMPQSIQRLREAAEQAKIALSTATTTTIHIAELYTDSAGNPVPFEIELSQAQFNQMIMDLVQRTFKVCDEAMQSARLTSIDIDGVILVGGPTRLGILRNSVRHYFQREPNVEVDPDQVVALGAAIQAEALLDHTTNTFLLDVTPQSLRVGTVGNFNEVIIEKNTAIPIERTKTFVTAQDSQSIVKVRIYQGESRKCDACKLLGEFEIGGFKLGRRGDVKIEVTFEIDTDGIVNVSASDLETGLSASTMITLSGGMDEAEIAEAAQRNAEIELQQQQNI